MDKNLIQRIISGVVYGLVIFLCTTPLGAVYLNQILGANILQEHLYLGLITFLMCVGAWECIRIMKFETWYQWLVFPLGLFVLYRFGARFLSHSFFYQFHLQELLGLALIFIAGLTIFKYPKELSFDNGKLIFTIIYTFLPFSFALGIPSVGESGFGWEVFMLFVLIWSSDSFAYFAGRMFGKHKMAPTISPKKNLGRLHRRGGLHFDFRIFH